MVKHENIEFKGLNCVKLYNGKAELIIPRAIGFRVLSFKLNGGINVFKNFDSDLAKLSRDKWQSFGGHRLWTAPEEFPRTYEIDGVPLERCEVTKNGLEIVQVTDKLSGIKKEVVIKLDDNNARVTVAHKITNLNYWPVKIAAWALSVMDAGGYCAIETPQNEIGLLSDRSLELWPYGRMNDSRVYWGDKIISLKQDAAAKTPFKFGAFAALGRALYVNGKTVFCKTFGNSKGEYPDNNCNFESYTNSEMIECESLSAFKTLSRGESITHTETWNLFETPKPVDFKDEKALLEIFKK